MLHLGSESVIQNLMIHSVSPQARKLVEQMYTCNPYEIDIKLDSTSKNRVAEVVNTYLKPIGLRLVFAKVPKYRYKTPISPFISVKNPHVNPFIHIPDEVEDKMGYYNEMMELKAKKENDENCVNPFKFHTIDIRRRQEQLEINNKAIEYKHLNPRQRYELYKKEQEEG